METATIPLGAVKLVKGRSHQVYKTVDGVKVPGVTTILNVVSKPQLIDWAWKLGLQNIDYKKVRDDAASVGTICHFMCECYLRGVKPDLTDFSKEQISLAENGFIKFLDYWEQSGFKILKTELQLVHAFLKYGGTIDCIAEDKQGKLVLLDLKTSKAIYSEYFSQVAAYADLYNHNNKDRKIERHIIVRIGKDEANDLEHQEINDLSHYLDLFCGALMVYKAQSKIKNLNK